MHVSMKLFQDLTHFRDVAWQYLKTLTSYKRVFLVINNEEEAR